MLMKYVDVNSKGGVYLGRAPVPRVVEGAAYALDRLSGTNPTLKAYLSVQLNMVVVEFWKQLGEPIGYNPPASDRKRVRLQAILWAKTWAMLERLETLGRLDRPKEFVFIQLLIERWLLIPEAPLEDFTQVKGMHRSLIAENKAYRMHEPKTIPVAPKTLAVLDIASDLAERNQYFNSNCST